MTDVDVYIAPNIISPLKTKSSTSLGNIVRRTLSARLAAGVQDKLGHYLMERLAYRPAIHCIGAALGFLTGDQVRIPDWVDRFYLGWFLRSLAQPRVIIPRFWSARKLPWLIWRYRDKLPPLHRRS